METRKAFLGEFLGTFMMVFFGTGVVALAVCFGEFASTWEIGAVWGIAVMVSIYATRHLSAAHFNPSVTFAMAVTKRLPWKRVPAYLAAQFIAAFCAGLMVYAVFHGAIADYEAANGIVRGTPESMASAKMFGEYYQIGDNDWVTMPVAMLAEAAGTFILVLMIFCMTEKANEGRPSADIWPVFVGLTLSICIGLFGPVSQAGFNAARDFAPRIVSLLFGWGSAAWPDGAGGFFWVYMLAPTVGGILAGLVFTKVFEKTMLPEPAAEELK